MAVKEVVTDEAGAVRIRGYASTPDLDRYRDIVEPTAFKDALGMYLKNPVLLRSHNPDKPVGLVDVATITEKGLWVEGIIKDKEIADEINAGLFAIKTFKIKIQIRHGGPDYSGWFQNPIAFF